MSIEGASSFMKPAVRCMTAGVCSAFAGPLGALTGAFIGGVLGHIIGEATEKFGEAIAEKLVERASETFLDSTAEWALERFKMSRPNLQGVYREAFRRSLGQIRKGSAGDYPDWFANWNSCLKGSEDLPLQDLLPSQINTVNYDKLFRQTMERLNIQGMSFKGETIQVFPDRPAPEPLLVLLKEKLPRYFPGTFKTIIIQGEQAEAWKELELGFRTDLTDIVSGIALQLRLLPRIADDVEASRAEIVAARQEIARLSQGVAALSQSRNERQMLGGTAQIRREDLLPIIEKEQSKRDCLIFQRDCLIEEICRVEALIASLQSVVGNRVLEGGVQ